MLRLVKNGNPTRLNTFLTCSVYLIGAICCIGGLAIACVWLGIPTTKSISDESHQRTLLYIVGERYFELCPQYGQHKCARYIVPQPVFRAEKKGDNTTVTFYLGQDGTTCEATFNLNRPIDEPRHDCA